MGNIVMGYWDCKYCSTIGVAGSEQECPNCGHPRDKDVKFYINKKTSKKVDKPTEQKVRERGKDWTCQFCDSLNPGNISVCNYCGSPKDATTQNVGFDDEQKIQDLLSTITSTRSTTSVVKPVHNDTSEKYTNNTFNDSVKTTNRIVKPINNISSIFHTVVSKVRNNLKIVGIAAISILLVALALFLLVPYDKQVEITDFSWSRSISIEELRTYNESDWSIPAGGRLKYTKEEIHHYDDVIDHYETKSKQVIDHYDEKIVDYKDLGNGYFEEITSKYPVYTTSYYEEPIYRKEPRYATKYYYEIDRWTRSRSIDTSGFDKSPYWGDVYLRTKEREGSRNGSYYVYTTDNSKYNLPEHQWNLLNKGDNVTLSVNRLGYAKLKGYN